ncbi:MAG: hypothetical protein ACAI43_17515 [Phycisphaerae bacterium]|nr:hypothetical protein [Tepidisphaeraceae bacterium]
MPTRRFTLAGALLLSLGLCFAGCLQQENIKVLRYDAKADRFEMLAVYEHFRSSDSGVVLVPEKAPDAAAAEKRMLEDAAKLRSIYDARDRLIPGWDILGVGLYPLTPDRKKFEGEGDPKPGRPAIAWDKVDIKPGRLFKDKDGFIGYWHEIGVPGAVVDQMLARVRVEMSADEDIRQGIAIEKKRRADAPQKPADWADITAALKAHLLAEQAGKPEGADRQKDLGERLRATLDSASLDRILAALDRGDLGPTRVAGRLVLRVPLTRRDADGIAGLVREVDRTVKSILDAKAEPAAGVIEFLAHARGPLSDHAALKADDAGLEISLDLVPLLNRFLADQRDTENRDFAKSADAKTRASKMAQTVATWKDVEVVPGDAEKLIAEFRARK